jgi:hypothetical protein
MAENRRDEASERDNDDVFIEYGSGGRDIKFLEIEGVKEGTSPAQKGVGSAGNGGFAENQ